jgi:hypothetical protein
MVIDHHNIFSFHSWSSLGEFKSAVDGFNPPSPLAEIALFLLSIIIYSLRLNRLALKVNI